MLDAIEATLNDKELRRVRLRETTARPEVVYEVTCNFDLSDHLLLIFYDKSGIEAANQMRHEFIANVSHELKTPLTVLICFVETLQTAAKDDAEVREQFLDRVWVHDIYLEICTVDIHIGRLRKSLCQYGLQDVKFTVRGAGYVLC